MRVLAFGSYDARAHPRIAVLLEGLRARGLDVEECNVPLRLTTADRVQILSQPWRLPRLAVEVLRSWVGLVRLARRLPAPDAVLVGYLGHLDVLLARRLFPRAPVVLDLLVFAGDTARDRGAGSLRQRALSWLDRLALRAADLVLVDTEEHLALLPAARRPDAVVVPVGAPAGWTAAPPSNRPAGDAVRVVFFGLFTPLQGAPVIGRALALLADAPGLEVTMVGAGQDLAQTRALAGRQSTVRWVDWVPAEELPGLVASCDICLGIFGTGEKALRVVPNKVYQGAAAGCAVITSDTAPQRRVLGDAAVLVPPGDAAALAAALRSLAGDRDRLEALRAAAWALAAASFAPAQVVAALADRLHALPVTRRAA